MSSPAEVQRSQFGKARAAPGTSAAAAGGASKKRFALRFFVPLGAFALLGLVLAYGVRHSTGVHVIHSPLVGKLAPQWSLPVLGGSHQMFGSRQLRGRWYMLNVWGTWCYACRYEHPELLRIARSSTVPIIGIDWMDHSASAEQFLNTHGNPYTQITSDPNGHVTVNWGVYGAPETFLVNPAGVVVFKQIGPITPQVWRKDIEARLPVSLRGGAS